MKMDETHPDREMFINIWNVIIKPEIEKYQSGYVGHIRVNSDAMDQIWSKYVSLNTDCKKRYMQDFNGRIDRHKVAACYMIAICSVKPMYLKDDSDRDRQDLYFSFNERLAITVGLSIVRAFLLQEISENTTMEKEAKDSLIQALDQGMYIPCQSDVHHGNYINNYAAELHYAVDEGNVHILSVAHELYLLELLTIDHAKTL